MAGFLATPSSLTDKQFTSVSNILQTGFPQTRSDPPNYEFQYTLVHSSRMSVVSYYFDTHKLFSPAFDPVTGTTVLCFGRPTISEEDSQIALNLPYTGGLANRSTLHYFLLYGINKLSEVYSGGAVTLILSPTSTFLITDVMGYVPVFLYNPHSPEFIISSSPRAISQLVHLTDDLVSMAEFLSYHKCTPPFTFHKEVRYAGAATIHHWNHSNRSYEHWEYWTHKTDYFDSFDQAVIATTNAVNSAIKDRTWFGKTLTYTSGGLDSRLILFAASNPSKIYALNMYDVENRESKIAKQLSIKSGSTYIGWGREKEYYPYWLDKGTFYSEGMWSMFDNHFLGTRDYALESINVDSIMSACSADMLFKECDLDRHRPKVFGKDMSWLSLSNKWNGGFVDPPKDKMPISKFHKEMQQRINDWFGPIPPVLNPPAHSHIADKRVRPLCYAPGLCFTLWYRTFPYDNFMADRRLADCYTKIRPEWRINASLWKRVVINICGDDIPNANTNLRPSASGLEQNIERLKVAASKVFKNKDKKDKNKECQLNNEGSWPTFQWYFFNSPILSELWSSFTPKEIDLFSDLIGENFCSKPLNIWKQGEERIPFRILTLLLYLRHSNLPNWSYNDLEHVNGQNCQNCQN